MIKLIQLIKLKLFNKMNFRTISIIVECPVVDALGAAYNHHASMRNKLLSLLNRSNENEKVGLIVLIEQARSIEWAKRIRQEHSILESIYSQQNNEDLSKEFLQSIIDINPEVFASSKKTNDNFFSYLEKLAKPILERKTLFLIPEFSNLDDNIIKSYAKEVTELINLENTPDFSFMPFEKSQNSGDKITRTYDFFIKQLVINTSLMNKINRVNNTDLEVCFDKQGPLLLDGKTGTGKSLTAQLLSIKKNKKINYINISSISKDLLESRMRGFVKGTFTDAKNDRAGWFEDANNNVLFLDEFQNSSLEVQTQLLDLLDPVSNKISIRRIGSSKDISLNVKVILAVNEPIEILLQEKRIRSDLYHRIRSIYKFPDLNVLFQSSQDTDVLLFIKKILLVYRWKSMNILSNNSDIKVEFRNGLTNDGLFPKFDFKMIDCIRVKYNWPGNFRELEIFAFDLYWKIDRDGVELNIDIIEKMLSEKNQLDYKECINIDGQQTQEKAMAVERAFENNDFKITSAMKDLKIYKLSSYQTLTKFIKSNREFFSKRFLSDPNILKILKEKNNKMP